MEYESKEITEEFNIEIAPQNEKQNNTQPKRKQLKKKQKEEKQKSYELPSTAPFQLNQQQSRDYLGFGDPELEFKKYHDFLGVTLSTIELLEFRKNPINDRIRGSFLGLAWGDAFGCPMEGWRDRNIQKHFPSETLAESYNFHSIFEEFGIKKLKRLRPLGLHSDDTQQCLALLNCCLSQKLNFTKKQNVEDIFILHYWANYVTAGMANKAWRGFGRNFSFAAGNLKKGVAPTVSGSNSAGIGAAMRIGPIGAVFRNNDNLLAQAAYQSALMTHNHIITASLCYAIVYAVKCLIEGKDAAYVRSVLPKQVQAQEDAFFNYLTSLPASLNEVKATQSKKRKRQKRG